jgi:hypothetical protein
VMLLHKWKCNQPEDFIPISYADFNPWDSPPQIITESP